MDNSNEIILHDLIKRMDSLTKKLDSVLESVAGYEGRIRLIESTQINNNFDLVGLKEMFNKEVKQRIELERKMIGLEDMVIKQYSSLHDAIEDVKGLIRDVRAGKA